MNWRVTITQRGRDGYIEYREGDNTCRCYWEFGGGDTVAIISMPSADDWDRLYPWAKGRRREVLTIVADEAHRQRAPSTQIEWDEGRDCIYLRENRRRR